MVTPSGLPGRDVAQVVERGFTHAFETAQTRSHKEEGKTAMALDQQRKQSNVTFQNAENVSYFVFAAVFRSFVGETLVTILVDEKIARVFCRSSNKVVSSRRSRSPC